MDENSIESSTVEPTQPAIPSVPTPGYYTIPNDLGDETTDDSAPIDENKAEHPNPGQQVPTVSPTVDDIESVKEKYLANKLRHKHLEALRNKQQASSQEVNDSPMDTTSQPSETTDQKEAQTQELVSGNKSNFSSKYCAELEPIKHLLNEQIGTYYIPLIGELNHSV